MSNSNHSIFPAKVTSGEDIARYRQARSEKRGGKKDINGILDIMADLGKQQGIFIHKDDLSDIEGFDSFVKTKTKYLEVKMFEVYTKKELISMREFLATMSADSDSVKFISDSIGLGEVDATIRESDSNSETGCINTMTITSALETIDYMISNIKEEDEYYTSRNLNDALNNSILKKSADNSIIKELKDEFYPFKFDESTKVSTMFGFSARESNNLIPSESNKLFKKVSLRMAKQFDKCIANGVAKYNNVAPGKKNIISFPGGSTTGFVTTDIKSKFAKYNFTFDSAKKISMIDNILQLSSRELLILVKEGLKSQGSRLQNYPNEKKNLRPANRPDFSKMKDEDKSNFPLYKEFRIIPGVQSSTGLSHRNVTGIQSSAQIQPAFAVQAFYKGIDDQLKKIFKFSAQDLNVIFTDMFNEGKTAFTCDVSKSEYNIDVNAILDIFFPNICDGAFTDIMKAVYEDTDSIGLFTSPDTGTRIYMQKCDDPDRFISGSIFTSLANMWYYASVQMCMQLTLFAYNDGLIDKFYGDFSDELIDEMLEKWNDTDFINQGDDCCDFIKTEHHDTFQKIIESNPYIKLEKEDTNGMLGKVVEQVSKGKDIKFITYATSRSLVFKTFEKYEGRRAGHPLRSSLWASIKGKFDLAKEFPFKDDVVDTEVCTDIFLQSLGIPKIEHDTVRLLALAEKAMLVYNYKKDIADDNDGKVYSDEDFLKSDELPKQIKIDLCVSHLLRTFGLNYSHEIFYKLTSDDIANSGAPFIEELFILVTFEKLGDYPFFREFPYFQNMSIDGSESKLNSDKKNSADLITLNVKDDNKKFKKEQINV